MHFDWDGLQPAGGFWANPGGGIEAGESRLEALRRELREETGLAIDELGPEVWTRTAVFEMADWDGQIDHIHLCRVEHFDPAPELTTAQLAAENVHGIDWWTLEEIAAADAARFSPRSLPELLCRLRDEGVPPMPIELDGF